MPRGSEHTQYTRAATGVVTVNGEDVPALVELRIAKDQPRDPFYGDDVWPLGYVDGPGSISMSISLDASIRHEELYDWIVNGDWMPHVYINAEDLDSA